MAERFIIADLHTESDRRAFLQSMTKPKIKEFLTHYGLRIKNYDRITKPKIIEFIVAKWPTILEVI
jgi:hypothetical protein